MTITKIKIFRMTSCWFLFACLIFSNIASAAQNAGAYTFAKRYNLNGQITGTISPDPDGSGPLPYPATRNTYNNRGLLTRVDVGYLTAWRNETIKPANWGGAFQISRSEIYTYNSLGWMLTKTWLASNGTRQALTQYSYDDYGRVECKAVRMNPASFASPPLSACSLGAASTFGPDRITRYSYDGLDRLLEERRAVGTPLEQAYATYTYDGNGQQTSVTDANRNTTRLEYDGFDRLEYWFFPSKTKGLGSHSSTDYEHYSYDANGNRLSLRKRDGKTIQYEYDNLNRVIRKNTPTGDRNVFYGYDLRSLQVHARFDSSSGPGITTAYTGFGEIKTETTNVSGTSYTISHLYDKNSQRERITHPDSKYFTYQYDGLNRLTTLRENGSAALTQQAYDNFSRPKTVVTGASSTTTSFAYDTLSRISTINYQLATTANNLALSFGYNPANQVVSNGINNNVYLYTGGGGTTGTYQSNGLNQYTSIAGQTIVHDANGNMTAEGGTSYTYDSENRLTRAQAPNRTVNLEYDPKGRLVKYTVQGVATHLIYDGDNLVLEIKNGNITNRYVHTSNMGTPAVSYAGSAVGTANRQFLHTNQQGSVIAITNNGGATNHINNYDAYGVPGSNNQGRFAYTGQLYLAELGLYHYRARTYSPKFGRFLQTDPIGYEDQMNLYAYVHNDPMNNTDPTGMQTVGGGILPNAAMYELYGIDGGNEYANMINRSQAIGGAIGFSVVGAAAYGGVAVNGLRAARFNRQLSQARAGRLRNWVESPSKTGRGSRFKDPNNAGNRVRIQQGNPKSQFPRQRTDYVKETRGGKVRDVNGDEIRPTTETPKPKDAPEAHIPLRDWLKKND